LGFTIAVATLTGVLFGLAPAWRAARTSPQGAMRAAGRGVVEGHSRFAAGKALVVGQVALSMVLVVGAGLLLGTMRTLTRLDPGFSRDGVLLVSAQARDTGAPDEARRAAQRELLRRLREIPGVRSASASLLTPLSGRGWAEGVEVDGFTPASRGDDLVFFNAVTDRFFETMGTALVAGREFDDRDRAGAPRAVVVNETLARKFFGAASPVGRQIGQRPHGDKPQPPLQVVGVVRDAKYSSLREGPRPTAYVPLAQAELFGFSLDFELRSAEGTPAAALVPAVKAVVAQADPRISLEFTTLAGQLAASLTRERLLATLSGFFGALALLLAVVGLYGTMAYGVARRRTEIGIRLALGAAPARVLRMVLGEAGVLVASGVALGALGALAASRLLASFLFGVTPKDPTTLALSALTLAAAAAAAAAVPAWRAARLDPMVPLREE
ncbi:MAG TPA: ABC transporter permease, partial [Gemmatimonadaceae bacterium]|nr:ABC transporter permease [Gemmatimonadaceae bacterium]